MFIAKLHHKKDLAIAILTHPETDKAIVSVESDSRYIQNRIFNCDTFEEAEKLFNRLIDVDGNPPLLMTGEKE